MVLPAPLCSRNGCSEEAREPGGYCSDQCYKVDNPRESGLVADPYKHF